MPEIRSGTILISGASSGIGEACVRDLDARGFRIFAGVRRDEDAARLRASASPLLTPVRLDVTSAGSIDKALATVEQAVGRAGLTGLVNNAGIAIPGVVEFLSLDRLREQLEVNLIGAVALTQAALPLLRAGRGRVVNMSSIAGVVAAPFLSPYAMSKHALEAFSDSLRLELRPWGIEVAVIEPGTVDTRIWEKGLRTADELMQTLPEEAERLYGEQIRAMRAVTEREAAAAAPATLVAEAVRHALTARRPRTRYVVGRDARLAVRLRRWLPQRLFDRLALRSLGLPR
ncbi:MAG: SDR family oxidoreductase [Chloroflexi bacterium]|nr:SDR family oxidoreductase [Chloroflexota bacterium]